jgi:hypothetical protein
MSSSQTLTSLVFSSGSFSINNRSSWSILIIFVLNSISNNLSSAANIFRIINQFALFDNPMVAGPQPLQHMRSDIERFSGFLSSMIRSIKMHQGSDHCRFIKHQDTVMHEGTTMPVLLHAFDIRFNFDGSSRTFMSISPSTYPLCPSSRLPA